MTISGATVTDAFVDGIQFVDNNSKITIAGARITDVGNNGITFVDGNSNVTIANTAITDTVGRGISFLAPIRTWPSPARPVKRHWPAFALTRATAMWPFLA